MDHVESRVRDRAYALWERDGRPVGRDEHYWLMAEGEMAATGDQAVVAMTADPVASPAKARASRPKAAAPAAETKAEPKTRAKAAPASAAAKAPRRRAAADSAVTTH